MKGCDTKVADDKKNIMLNTSPYNQSFPAMLLEEAFEFQLNRAERVAHDIYDAVTKDSAPVFPLVDSERESHLIVDVSDDVMQDIHDGKIKLVEENNQFFAQLRENGHYSKKLPVKEKTFGDELSVYQAANALQLKAIQESLQKLSVQIKAIDESVRDVINGQQTDRIGMYYSGVSLFMEASAVSNPSLKESLLAQSIKALTESSFQLTLIMQSDIRYIKNKEYESKKKIRTKLISEKMASINQCFSIIHQSSILKAGIYCQAGEFAAMGSVLEEYSRFIAGTVAQNASLLAQCDISDDGTILGVWKSRANVRLDASDITSKLKASNESLYLDLRKEDEQNESI